MGEGSANVRATESNTVVPNESATMAIRDRRPTAYTSGDCIFADTITILCQIASGTDMLWRDSNGRTAMT